MPYFKHYFQRFDPVTDDTTFLPFSFPDIVKRARSLLQYRTKEQIEAMAIRVSEEIDCRLEDGKYLEIERLREQAGLLEAMGGDPKWSPDDEELDIPTWSNTSEVDALKSIMEDKYTYGFFGESEPKPEDYQEGKEFEMFAALSLWLVAEALYWYKPGNVNLSLTGEYAVKAMDAVCQAEHLNHVKWLESYAKQVGGEEYAAALRKHKSEQSRNLNHARHRETNKARALVTGEWEKDRNKFQSAEKAGRFFADWLEKVGILNTTTKQPYEPRTVIDWIRAHAKKKGIRFR